MTSKMHSTLPKPFIFVLMPFAEEFQDTYEFGIKGAAAEVDAYAERVDEQIFSEGMLERIFNQISKADVIVADMTGKNANVFYEVGYAHALDKVVILLTRDAADIPFDLKHFQHIVYGGSINSLKPKLVEYLGWAIDESSRRRLSRVRETISVKLQGNELRPAPTDSIKEIRGEVTSKSFSFDITVKNRSASQIEAITHLYWFAAANAPVVPVTHEVDEAMAAMVDLPGYSPTNPVEVSSFVADTLDSEDGLERQYKLPLEFPPMPRGASESRTISLYLRQPGTAGGYRLRIHCANEYFDYPFRLLLE